jgi:NOL1/NOP2/sun family putative RNA methylase
MNGDRSQGGLSRYQGIIPDWEAFQSACGRPLPATLRVHTMRGDVQNLASRLARQGFPTRPVAWAPDFLVADREGVGKTIEHWLGLFYVQELVQALPVLALDPRPGETVLDLCAAPGGKTTHTSDRMESRGLLVANEPNGRRMQALLANLNRVGALNVAVTGYRGESFPLAEAFDRVLVDAPCSAEGTLRREKTLRQGAYPSVIKRMALLQRRLILRGYDLLRPGGTLVYSTCTFAPEENEAVVAFLLDERDARLEPAALPVVASSGLAKWEDAVFPHGMEACVRVYPHELDSGGGFLARLRKP